MFHVFHVFNVLLGTNYASFDVGQDEKIGVYSLIVRVFQEQKEHVFSKLIIPPSLYSRSQNLKNPLFSTTNLCLFKRYFDIRKLY